MKKPLIIVAGIVASAGITLGLLELVDRNTMIFVKPIKKENK